MTAALSLDATVVLLTPVVFATAVRLRLRPKPQVYACTHLANSASLLLPVSNLTNLLAFRASGLSFARFATTGATVWTASDGGGVQSTATVLDGIVYVSLARGLGDQRLHAFDGATGASVWTSEVDASAGPVLANGVLYVGTDGISTSSGVLVALNPASGVVLWSRLAAGDSSPVTSVVVANGAVYAVNEFAVSAHHA